MRVVLDTNVLISGVFFAGPPYRILQVWRNGRVRLVVSSAILEEYARVGQRLGHRYGGIDLRAFLQLLTVSADLVKPRNLDAGVCDDPDDDKFVACALGGRAPIIVSGDKGLLRVSGYCGVEILAPAVFIERYNIG